MRDLDWVLETFTALPAALPQRTVDTLTSSPAAPWKHGDGSDDDKEKDSLVGMDDFSKDQPAAASGRRSNGAAASAVALALTPINTIKDVFLGHREKLIASPNRYSSQQLDILKSICNMVIKICTLYRIDPLSKILKRHQQFIGDATRFLKNSEQEFLGGAEVCTATEDRYYKLVYTYQTVALLPIVAPRSK